MRKLLLAVHAFAALGAFADLPTCKITVAPDKVAPGQSLTVTMTTTGEVDYASINGQPVTAPRGQLSIVPVSFGDYAVRGFVRGPEGSWNCFGSYSVVSLSAPVWLRNPVELPLACKDLTYEQNLGRYVTSIGGEALTFHASTMTPHWLQVTRDGRVLGTPSAQDLGPSTFEVQAVNPRGEIGKTFVVLDVQECSGGVLTLPAVVGKVKTWELSYSGPGEWTKLSGPSWVRINLNGHLEALPGVDDVGDSQVVVAWRHDNVVEKQIVVIQVSPK